MQTALAIGGGISTVALTIAVVYLVHALLSGLASERASFAAEVLAGKAQVAAELAQRAAEREKEKAERERDEAIAARTKAEIERDDATARLVETQRALNKALEEDAHATVEAIRAAPTAVDALAELERLLQATARGEAVPDTGGAGPSTGGDHGDA